MSAAAYDALADMGTLQHAEALEPVALLAALTKTQAYHRQRDAKYEGSAAEALQSDVKRHAADLVSEGGPTAALSTFNIGLESGVQLQLARRDELSGEEEETGEVDTLRSYERVQLVTLGPQTAEEAFALIPSLARFTTRQIRQIVDEMHAHATGGDAA